MILPTLFFAVVMVIVYFGKLVTMSWLTLVLLGLATSRTARAISYEHVFDWLRVPFCKLEDDPSGAGQNVEPRTDRGPIVYKIGQLLSCPFCIGTWVAIVLVGIYTVPFGQLLVYGLAVACVSEVIHRVVETLEWVTARSRAEAGLIWDSQRVYKFAATNTMSLDKAREAINAGNTH